VESGIAKIETSPSQLQLLLLSLSGRARGAAGRWGKPSLARKSPAINVTEVLAAAFQLPSIGTLSDKKIP
jgi:hypothetical protein